MYDEFWSGGVADIMPERGKQVFGALFRAGPAARERLDRLAHRSIDRWGRESGLRWLVPVQVIPYGGVKPVKAWTYRLIRHEWQHVPPTRRYLDKLVAAACEVGHSMAWAMHLRSFAVRETPRRPPLLRAEPAFPHRAKPVRWRTNVQQAAASGRAKVAVGADAGL